MNNRKPRAEDYEIVKAEISGEKLVFKRGINPSEEIDFSEYPYQVVIRGDVGADASVRTKCNLTIEGKIGAGSTVISETGYVSTGDIDANSVVRSRLEIYASNIGANVSLTSASSIYFTTVDSSAKLMPGSGKCFKRTDSNELYKMYDQASRSTVDSSTLFCRFREYRSKLYIKDNVRVGNVNLNLYEDGSNYSEIIITETNGIEATSRLDDTDSGCVIYTLNQPIRR